METVRRLRRWLTVDQRQFTWAALAVVGAGSLTYVTEQLMLEGLDDLGPAWWLALIGLAAAMGLSWIAGESLLRSRKMGVNVHLVAIRDESWLSRHQAEDELLTTDARRESDRACLTGLGVARGGSAESAQELTSWLIDSVAVGSAVVGDGTIRVLPGGDIPTIANVGFLAARLLGERSVVALTDRGHEEGLAFLSFECIRCQSDGSGVAGDMALFVDVRKTNTDKTEPGNTWAEGEGLKPTHIVRQGLPEEIEAYTGVLEEVRSKLPSQGTVYLGFAGPSAMAFAIGYLIGTNEQLELRALTFENNQYSHATDPIEVRGTALGHTRAGATGLWRLWLVGLCASLLGTLAVGNVVTLLEWSVARSVSDPGPTAGQWSTIGLIIGGGGLLFILFRRWYRKLASPDFVIGFDKVESPNAGVLPRRDLPGPYERVKWLQNTLASLAAASPESQVVISLDGLDEASCKAIGNYLSIGHRGAELKLSAGRECEALSVIARESYEAGAQELKWARTGYASGQSGSQAWVKRPEVHT